MKTATSHFDELCLAAERRGLRVLLELEGEGLDDRGRPLARLSRVVVDDPRRRQAERPLRGEEVVGLPIGGERGLEASSKACLTFLLRAKTP